MELEGKLWKITNYHTSKSDNPNRVMESQSHDTTEGTNIRQYDFDDAISNKLWVFKRTSDGVSYTINPLNCTESGMVAEIKSGSCGKGTDVKLAENTGTAQHWMIEVVDSATNRVKIKPLNCLSSDPEMVLETQGEGTGNGTNIRIWENDTKDNKYWLLDEYEFAK